MANTIYLYGELGRKYGKRHRIHIASPAEAIRALAANFDDFLTDLLKSGEKGIGYRIVVGKSDIGEKQLYDPTADAIKIIPVIQGAKQGGVTQILLAAILVVVALYYPPAAAYAPQLYGMAASMALGGITQMLSAQSKSKKPSENSANDPSYVFSGPVNTTAQGHPVPVGYGRLIVGSAVISAGISIEQVQVGVDTTGTTGTGGIPIPTWFNPVTNKTEEVPPPTVIYNVNSLEYELPDGTPLVQSDPSNPLSWHVGSSYIYLNTYLHRMELHSPTVLAQWDGSGTVGTWRMYVYGDWKGDAITLNETTNRYENTLATGGGAGG